MKQLVISISDNKFNFFMEVLKSFSFIKKVTPLNSDQQRMSENLKNALKEVDQHEKGKIKLQSAKDFLNEL